MKKLLSVLSLLLLVYAATGIFVIRVDEKGTVRRFGRLVRANQMSEDPTQSNLPTPRLLGSGVHWDLPWPFAQVDRVNLSQVRTVRICGRPLTELDASQLLRTAAESSEPQFLTGDKNILNLDVTVDYRVSEQRVEDYLYGEADPERRLKLLVETILMDFISRSGVDYVHPLGLAELQVRLTQQASQLVELQGLGVEVESVNINSVAPPARVKADFLDVSNARNDREKYINSARAYAETKTAEARAEQYRSISEARSIEQQLTEQARATADSFLEFVQQVDAGRPNDVAEARRLALQRQYLDTLEAVLSVASGKVMLEGGRQVDLTILKPDQ